MSSRDETIPFWQSRLLQGGMLFVLSLMILPVFWIIFYLGLSGELFLVAATPFDVVLLAGQPFPKSLLTAIILSLLLAVRSITWGSVGLRFCLFSGLLVSLLFDFLTRGLALFFDADILATQGWGGDDFFVWEIAWGGAALCFYAILWLCGFHRRYNQEIRKRNVTAFWALSIYGIFAPILYEMVWQKQIYGDELPTILAIGDMANEAEGVASLMTMLVCLLALIGARRISKGNFLFLIFVPFLAGLLALGLMMATSFEKNFVPIKEMVSTLFICACLLALLAGFGLRLLAQKNNFSNVRWPFVASFKQRLFYALRVGSVVLTVAPPLYQLMMIVVRGLFIGIVPSTFFLSGLERTYLHSGVIFSLICALYTFWRGTIHYPAFFICAFLTSSTSLLFATAQLGGGGGFYSTHFSWPMLLLLPSLLGSSFVLRLVNHLKPPPSC